MGIFYSAISELADSIVCVSLMVVVVEVNFTHLDHVLSGEELLCCPAYGCSSTINRSLSILSLSVSYRAQCL